ncbi:MAG TPA: hypothetical protein VHC69_27585 [Polyangiaceae bacterium]|nr:hypothetical protein [Polyangiaceae bacterium]
MSNSLPRSGFPRTQRRPSSAALTDLVRSFASWSNSAAAEKSPLPAELGRDIDIVGTRFYVDLVSMPHVTVAGTTGDSIPHMLLPIVTDDMKQASKALK